MAQLLTLERETAPRLVEFTRQACTCIQSLGLLPERYELVEGQIIHKMGQPPRHNFPITALIGWLGGLFGPLRLLSQSSIDVAPQDNDTNEPQPDVIVLREPGDPQSTRNPRPEQILLLVEVADTTRRFDLTTKARLYARAGIPEYWVLDVPTTQLIRHRLPTGDSYAEITTLDQSAAITAPTTSAPHPVRALFNR